MLVEFCADHLGDYILAANLGMSHLYFKGVSTACTYVNDKADEAKYDHENEDSNHNDKNIICHLAPINDE